jgi:hypothetical protein
MGQFGLEVVDRRLGLLEQVLCMLSCRDLLPQSLPCRFESIGAGCVALIPVDDRDRNLAIPDEAPTLWMRCTCRRRRRNRYRVRLGRIAKAEGTAHLRLVSTEAFVI